jgi:hypothetical protein
MLAPMVAKADNILPNSSAETGTLPDADFWLQEFGTADVIVDSGLAKTGNRVWQLDAANADNNICSVGQLPVVEAGEKFTVSAWVRIPNASPTRQVNVRQRWGFFLPGGGFDPAAENGSAQYYIKDSNWHLITGPEITCQTDGAFLVARIYVMNQYREFDGGPDIIDTGNNNFPAYVDDLTAESPDYTFSTVSGSITDGGSGVAGALVRATQTAIPAIFSVSAPSDAAGNYSLTCRVGREYELSASSLPAGRAVETSPAPFTPANTSPITGKNLTLGVATRYEAEDAVLSGCSIQADGIASNGFRVAANNFGGNNTVTYTLNVPAAGLYPLTIGYYQPWDVSRDTYLTVNGAALGTIPSPRTTGPNYGVTEPTNVALNAGANTVVLSNGIAWGPHWDYIDLQDAVPSATINASAGVGGSISPSGPVEVAVGADLPITVTPDKYFDVTSVLVDGSTELVSSPNAQTYTLNDVTANGSIAASFTEWALTEITGKVALGDGTGVADILVTVSGGREPYTALTNVTGTYSIRVKPGVTYTVSANKKGWGITPASLTAGPGSLTSKNFVAQFVGNQRLVHLVASPDLTNDALLTSWPNQGTLGGTFIADGGFDTAAPTTRASIGGNKAVQFNNHKMLLSSTSSTADRIMAPASITGPGSNFTVFAKLYAEGAGQNDPWEQFFLAWSRRDGPSGTCASFGYAKGWWGAIGGWGYGDTNYGALYPGTDRTVAPAWGQWNAVAMTSDGTTVTIYYNGQVVNTVTKTLNWHAGMPISLGSQYWGDDGMGRALAFNGSMMELSIYDGALSASEIATLSTFYDPNDTDADHMPDAWEITAVGNLTDLTLNGDFDKDGTSDAAEYRLGLIPNDAKSRFAATVVRNPVTGFVTLTWPSKMGATFDVMWSENMTSWDAIGTVEDTTEEGSTETFIDNIGDILNYPKSFYRVLLKP